MAGSNVSRGLQGIALLTLAAVSAAPAVATRSLGSCVGAEVPELDLSSGHAWRPRFGTERVGAPLVVHAQLAGKLVTGHTYSVAALQGGREQERHALEFRKTASAVVASAQLSTVPDEIALSVTCGGRVARELVRQQVAWPDVEAAVNVHAASLTNPVDLGAIFVPGDWLLLSAGEGAQLEFAGIARLHELPNARLSAWFDGADPVHADVPLIANKRATARLQLPPPRPVERSLLHVALKDGAREIWKHEVPTMIVSARPHWPAFGAVETKLRYDAPISVKDPKTGATLAGVDYETAWDPRLNDVVVFLPNDTRFVFWRGSSYAPFWAGRYNTGFSYQWAETIPPRGFVDAVEPLQDKELRYGRVRILESTSSRVHVRWSYQSVDFAYRSLDEEAIEDFYFYPDGFGTRVVTLASDRPKDYVYSEFIILAPNAAFPLEILPEPRVDMLFLDGTRQRIEFPLQPGAYQPLTIKPSNVRDDGVEQHPVERLLGKVLEYQGESVHSSTVELINRGLGKIPHAGTAAALYRITDHKLDVQTPIYFAPSAPRSTIAFLPFFDRGELVTPGYWGDHWPLGRGAMTGGAIGRRIQESPSHLALMDLDEPPPISSSESQMLDPLGRARRLTVESRAWLIAKTDATDDALLAWAQSFSNPPSLEVQGARIDFPSYRPERRALRLIIEAPTVEIQVRPAQATVNPVFELAAAPAELLSVSIDDEPLAADDYAWDGATLWIRAQIGSAGKRITLQFRDALPPTRRSGVLGAQTDDQRYRFDYCFSDALSESHGH